MPNPDTASDVKKQEQADNTTAMLKWILGGVAAGIVGIGFFAQVAFNTFMTRDEASQNFLRQDLKAGIETMSAALEKVDDRNELLVRTIDNQTRILENIRDDQRKFPAVAAPP